MTKQYTNCPGAVDHTTAECPIRAQQKMDHERASFQREDRYVVLKRKHLANLPNDVQYRLKPALDEAAQLMPAMECVVVESDWPEYPVVWRMIEARMTGASLQVGVPDALREAVEYLDGNNLNRIASGSVLHRAMSDALAAAPAAQPAAEQSAPGEVAPEWEDKTHLVSVIKAVVGRERMRPQRLTDDAVAEAIYKAIGEHLPIYEDVYDQCSEIIEPHVARPHRPDGMLPGSVVDSLRLLLNYRLAARDSGEVRVPRDLLADLVSQDHDTRIQAERRMLALLAQRERG